MPDTSIKQVQSCSFWQLPEAERAEVIATAPIKNIWELDLERLKNGYWQFSIPELKTINELLIGGTELLLDHHYRKTCGIKPDADSRMIVRVSSEPMELNHAILQKISDDPSMPNAATYIDESSKIEGWLCGWLAVIFGKAPQTIYANVFPYS